MNKRCVSIKLSFPVLVVLALILAGVAMYRRSFASVAPEARISAADHPVVSINLSRIFNLLDESEIVRVNLKAMDDEIIAHKEQQDAKLTQMLEELETVGKGTAQERRISEQILVTKNMRDAWIDAKTRMRALEESLEYVRLYDKVIEYAAELAAAHGYDYILLDDTDIEMRTDRTPQETVAQLFTRRMIFRNPECDITDDLIDRMNNAFAAGE